MLNVVIVEDKVEDAEAIDWELASHPRRSDMTVVRLANIRELRNLCSRHERIDIVFMDVHFENEDTDGIQVVKELFPAGCGTQVIFVTGYTEYCTSVYQSPHTSFLLKPIKKQDFDLALDIALRNLADSADTPFAIQTAGSVLRVSPHEVDYIESALRKVRIHTKSGVIETYSSLSDMRKVLPDSFVQCHRSYIVNLDSVKELERGSVTLFSGAQVPVSQKRYASLRDELVQRFLTTH